MCARRVAATHTDDMRAWLAAAAALALLVATARSSGSEVSDDDSSCELAITVQFPSGAEVSLGNELTPTQVKDQPFVTYPADIDSFYTLLFLGRMYGDAEYPSLAPQPGEKIAVDPVVCETSSEYREYLHWLMVNIPGNLVGQGQELAQCVFSAPRLGTGLHRYTFLLYKQPGKLQFDEKWLNNTAFTERDRYCAGALAEKYSLGAPVGGNFYYSQYDDYVPYIFKTLGVEYLLNATYRL